MSDPAPTFPQRIAAEVARLGGTAQVARACGYSQRQVEYWAKGLHLPRETARVGVLALLEAQADYDPNQENTISLEQPSLRDGNLKP